MYWSLFMRRYPPVRACIYCDAESHTPERNSPLGEEHIIPLCLCGKMILEEASCRKCERETGRTEQLALQGVYRVLREKLGYPHRHKETPRNKFPIFIPTPGGGKDTRVDILLSDYPHAHFFLTPPAPGLLIGVPLNFNYGLEPRWFRAQATFKIGETPENLKKYGVDSAFSNPSLDLMSFCKMLAKIGHSYAIAELGVNKFIPLLRDVILGKEKNVFHFVGGKADSQQLPPSSRPYEIGLEEQIVDGVTYLVASIRIFATLEGSPTYLVVVGLKDK
jgi:hypothetical protein